MTVGQVLKPLFQRVDSFGRRMPKKSKRVTNYKPPISPNLRSYVTKPEDAWLITSFFNVKIDYKFSYCAKSREKLLS